MLRILTSLLALWPVVVAADPLRGGTAPVPVFDLLPAGLRPLLAQLVAAQRDLVFLLQRHIDGLRDGTSPGGMWLVVGVAALYGVLHAAGPGHGKVVVAGYLASRRARLAQALRMSALISAVQAGSAITLVAVLSAVTHAGSRALMDRAALFETASFALIGGFGLFVAWRALRGGPQACCHGGCGHDHHENHGHETLMGSVAVGLRPCTGALLILLFTFANGLAWLGIAATLAMSAGSAVTVAAVGAGAVGVRTLAGRVAPPWLGRVAAVAAGMAIALVGFGMMAATLAYGPTGG